MNKQAFDAYRSAGYTHVPVYREILADLDTPLSAYLKLADGPNTFLFESVQGGERWGRYSIIGMPARTTIEIQGDHVRVLSAGAEQESVTVGDPFQYLRDWLARRRVAEPEGLPHFLGGLVGSFGYETVRHIEQRALGKLPRPEHPEIRLMVAEEVAIFDNLSGRLFLVVVAEATEAGWSEAQQRLDVYVDKLRAPLQREPAAPGSGTAEDEFRAGFLHDDFCNAVETVRDYIRAGDVMQVVLSQRLSVPFTGAPLDVYRALRSFNPSPYMYFLDYGGWQIAGASPEVLVRAENGEVTVRPIAGTRPRGATAAEDREYESDLLADPKELAEHLMLIDLGRNDVGRVSEIGSVELTERMVIERYSHVMHIVSQVNGRLRAGLDGLDALQACFPAGTLSGAPKLRAMEIIGELEPGPRGVYGGAIGYLGWQGNLDTAIAIRTALIENGELQIQAGAGIVHDSVPENEWQETLNKGRAVLRAVDLAVRGLEHVVFEPRR